MSLKIIMCAVPESEVSATSFEPSLVYKTFPPRPAPNLKAQVFPTCTLGRHYGGG